MERWRGKVAVITGASSGIGAAIAERLVKEGLIVVGIARRKELIEELAQKLNSEDGKLHSIKADFKNESEIMDAFKWIKDNVGPIHILVNSAGIFRRVGLRDGDTQLWKDVIDVNVLALCIATREAIKEMRANNVDGHIIHINSTIGRRVTKNSSIYGATKFSVTALTETLRQELNSIGSKIKITSLSPGLTRTGIFQEIYGEGNIPKQLRDVLDLESAALNSEDIADAAVYILGTPPHVQVHELTVATIIKK